MPSPGIYVETQIHGELDKVWQKTQDPDLHQRWDLRFTSITYLPRPEGEPQRFLYSTRIGFGIAIIGSGESIGEHNTVDERTSSLRFWSDDAKSLITEGRGYWKYIRKTGAIQFFTWYDYQVRFGSTGRIFDRLCFRPLMSWATAWSFDRLRLWIEDGLPPETVLRWTIVYSVARLVVAFIWIWHGLVPKLLFPQSDEKLLLSSSGLPAHWLPLLGIVEIALGLVALIAWRWRLYFVITALAMLAATVSVATSAPAYLTHAFNPGTLNLAVAALSVVGWIAHGSTAFAGRCLRRPSGEDRG